jgi:hypothetical protein
MKDEKIIEAVVEFVVNARNTAERLMDEEPHNEEYYAGKADAYMNVHALISRLLEGDEV